MHMLSHGFCQLLYHALSIHMCMSYEGMSEDIDVSPKYLHNVHILCLVIRYQGVHELKPEYFLKKDTPRYLINCPFCT